MKSQICFCFFLLLLVVPNNVTVAEAQKKLDEFNELRRKRNLPDILARYSDDAVIMPDHHPCVKGKAEIEKFYKGMWERDPNNEIDGKLTVTDVHEHGEMVSVRGTATMNIKDKNFKGKWVHVLKKEGDTPKLHFAMWNGDEEPPEFAKLLAKKK